jgi:hypothetical protein
MKLNQLSMTARSPRTRQNGTSALPFAEVKSGYTSFFLGARSNPHRHDEVTSPNPV